MSVNAVSERAILKEKSFPARAKKKRGRIRNKIITICSLLMIAFLILCAVFPGWIATHSPLEMSTNAILQAPSFAHILGTDQFGRDIFSLLVYGSRSSLMIGIASVLIGGILGALIGLFAGYWGNLIDSVLMRSIEILMSIPGILLAIILASSLGASMSSIVLAVGLSAVPGYARVMRSQVIAVRSFPFIDAARAIGTSHLEINVRHIVPNCLSPLLVMATIGVGNAILMSTGLSFLGLGVISEIPDWGFLLSQGRDYLNVAWWIGFFPGAAIALLVIAVNLLGDELRNRLDPKKRF